MLDTQKKKENIILYQHVLISGSFYFFNLWNLSRDVQSEEQVNPFKQIFRCICAGSYCAATLFSQHRYRCLALLSTQRSHLFDNVLGSARFVLLFCSDVSKYLHNGHGYGNRHIFISSCSSYSFSACCGLLFCLTRGAKKGIIADGARRPFPCLMTGHLNRTGQQTQNRPKWHIHTHRSGGYNNGTNGQPFVSYIYLEISRNVKFYTRMRMPAIFFFLFFVLSLFKDPHFV